jgi:hypothetical protein
MAILSVDRPGKRRRNDLTCPPVCRTVLSLFAMAFLAHAWQSASPPADACKAAGQIGGWDLLERTLTLKSDSGDYSDFHFDDSTKFTNGETSVPREALDIDDRLCVVAFRAGSPEIASEVRVTRRSEIEGRDRQELVRWQGESLFGTVKSLDAGSHKITLSVAGSAEFSVNAAGSVAFWKLPAAAHGPADAVQGGWESLATGDVIYVRGERAAGMRSMQARLIVSGGFRSFTGSVESIEPLTGLVHLRDFRVGRSRPVHFNFMSIYVVGKSTAPGVQDRHLYSATVGDLKQGDSVLVLGRENGETGDVEAFLMVTGFAPGGFLRPGPGQSADWIFQAVGLDGKTPK